MENLELFTTALTDKINHMVSGMDIKAEMTIVTKNNQTRKIGLAFHQKEKQEKTDGTEDQGDHVCFMRKLFDAGEIRKVYEKGIPMEYIAESLIMDCMMQENEGSPETEFDCSQITDYKKVRGRLALKLVNRKLNEQMLADTPHICIWEDLACVCYIALKQPEGGKVMVQRSWLEGWDVTKSELMQTAMENTEKLFPAEIKNLADVIGKFIPCSEKEDNDRKVYIVTNVKNTYGAVCILYKGLLKRIATMLESDLILLPSSVHEFLVVPYRKMEKRGMEFNQMIKEVNAEHLDPEEILSDHAYMYCRETGDVCSL